MENNKYPELNTVVEELGRYGAAVFELSYEEFLRAGYEPGDLVEVCINGEKFAVPAGTAYSDVDTGSLVLIKIAMYDRMILAQNNVHGFAEAHNIKKGDAAVIRMLSKGGCLEEYELRKVTMSGERSDYGTDEEFANFRAVKAGKIAEGRLLRGFSPINPSDGRSTYADALLKKAGAETAINLDNESEEQRELYPGYHGTYYSTLRVVPVKMSFSVREESFPRAIEAVLNAIALNEAPYYIHCRYSRDRTGLLCAILEALSGASFTEIREDYMLSYENIHHLEKGSPKWEFQAGEHVDKVLKELLGTDDLSCGLKEKTEEVLNKKYGIKKSLIKKAVSRLCGKKGCGSR